MATPAVGMNKVRVRFRARIRNSVRIRTGAKSVHANVRRNTGSRVRVKVRATSGGPHEEDDQRTWEACGLHERGRSAGQCTYLMLNLQP